MELLPYQPPQTVHADRRCLRLDTNESPYAPLFNVPGSVSLNRYPDPHSEKLCASIARHHALKAENVLCGAGSTDVLGLIVRRFAEKGVAALDPSFGLYRACAMEKGVPYHGVPLDRRFRLDRNALEAVPADLRIICNPNNPTGSYEDSALLSRLSSDFDGVTMIDEAYAEYAEAAGHDSCVPLVRDGASNVIVVRTCSKALGFAALRIGYALAHRDLIRRLLEVKPPFNLSGQQQNAGVQIFDNLPDKNDMTPQVIRDRDALSHNLETIHCKPLPSDANFLLFDLPKGVSAPDVHARLRDDHQILVRIFPDHPRIGNMLRVTVGTPEENERFIGALQMIFSQTVGTVI